MRQLRQFGECTRNMHLYLIEQVLGWMHNRCRMIVAMYLTKDLMLDWKLGERVCTVL
jgi:hypothetical protein